MFLILLVVSQSVSSKYLLLLFPAGSMAMVIPRLPDRADDNRDLIVGLFPHFVAVAGTGADFQRKYEGSRRFSTFLLTR